MECGVKTTGFANIVSHLRNHHSGAYDLEYNLTHRQQTDRTAYASIASPHLPPDFPNIDPRFTSFLQSTAGPLVDLSLYVSSENYSSTTSSAYTAILPWFANYILPPKRRNLARARTVHLGLASLDVKETEHNRGPGSGTAASEYEAAKRAAGIPTDSQPKVLSMGRKQGLGGLLSAPIYAARFKLDALANELLEPLSDLLGKKDYLLDGDKPSSLDCLVFGYLALMFYPPVPQAWLKETIQTRYPRITRYIRRLRNELIGDEEVNAGDVWSVSTGQADAATLDLQLPWRSRGEKALLAELVGPTREALGNVPLLSSLFYHRPSLQRGARGPIAGHPSSLPSPFVVHTLTAFLAAATAGFAGLAVYHRRFPREGPLIFWALRPQLGLSASWEAQSFLGVLAGQLQHGTFA